MTRLNQYSEQEIAGLMTAFKKSRLTITRWIAADDDRLTSVKAMEAIELANKNRPEVFQKDNIYLISGKKMKCFLLDDSLAVVAPVTVSRNGNTKMNLRKIDCYATQIENLDISLINK